MKHPGELGSSKLELSTTNRCSGLRNALCSLALSEIGITNPDSRNEVSECALGDPGLETPLTAEPEDTTDADGRADIDRFADFMRALKPPPSVALSNNLQGALLFAEIGCADCHTPSLTTSSNPTAFIPATTGGVAISASLNQALSNKTFHPFSDFLLHDMVRLETASLQAALDRP